MEDKPSAEDKGRDLLTLIPEVYYDLIARVAPGSILVLSLIAVWLTSSGKPILDQLTTLSWASSVAFPVILLTTSYVAGILLTPIGSLFSECYGRWWWPRVRNSYNIEAWNQARGEDNRLPLTISWDRYAGRERENLKDRNKDTKIILIKLVAEYMLGYNLAAAFIVTLFVDWYVLGIESLLLAKLPFAALLLSFWAGWYRQGKFVGRMFSILGVKKKDRKPTHWYNRVWSQFMKRTAKDQT